MAGETGQEEEERNTLQLRGEIEIRQWLIVGDSMQMCIFLKVGMHSRNCERSGVFKAVLKLFSNSHSIL